MRFRRTRTKDKDSHPDAWDYIQPTLDMAVWRDSEPFDDTKVKLLMALVEQIVGRQLDVACCYGEPSTYQVMPFDDGETFPFWLYWLDAGQQWYERPEDALINFALGYLHWKKMGMPTENAE